MMKIIILISTIIALVSQVLFGSSVNSLKTAPDAVSSGLGGMGSYQNTSVWRSYKGQAQLPFLKHNCFGISYKNYQYMFNQVSIVAGFNKVLYGYASAGMSFLHYGRINEVSGVSPSTGLIETDTDKTFAYDFMAHLSYAYRWHRPKFNLGVSVKYLQQEVDGRALFHWALDVDTLKFFDNGLMISLGMRNLEVNLSTINNYPMHFYLGTSLPLKMITKKEDAPFQMEIIGEFNLTTKEQSFRNTELNLFGVAGARFLFKEVFSVNVAATIGRQATDTRFLNLGFGYKFQNNLEADYSFTSSIAGFNNTHTTTLTYVNDELKRKKRKDKKKEPAVDKDGQPKDEHNWFDDE